MSRMKRREEDGSFSRLVYSTGGHQPAEPPRPRPAPSPAPGRQATANGGGQRLRLEKRPN